MESPCPLYTEWVYAILPYLGAVTVPGLAGVLAELYGLEVVGPVVVAGAALLLLLHEGLLYADAQTATRRA